MKIYLAGALCRQNSRRDLNKVLKIKNHLESYHYLKNKPNFIKELKDGNKKK